MSEQAQTFWQFFFAFAFVGISIYYTYVFYQMDKKYGGWSGKPKSK